MSRMITCTCGHKVENFGECKQALVKDMLKDGTPAVSMDVLCFECYDRLLEADYLLKNQEEVYLYNRGFIEKRKR